MPPSQPPAETAGQSDIKRERKRESPSFIEKSELGTTGEQSLFRNSTCLVAAGHRLRQNIKKANLLKMSSFGCAHENMRNMK